MQRIAEKIEALAEHLLADPGLPLLRGERAAPFFRASRIEAVDQKPDQIGDGLRFENHLVVTGLDRLGLLRADRLGHGLLRDLPNIQPRQVEMIAGVVAGARAVGASRRHTEVGRARAEIPSVAVRSGDRACKCRRSVKPRARHFRAAAHLERGGQRRGASVEIDAFG